MATIFNTYFDFLLLNSKTRNQNLIGSMGVTCRSKIAKIVLMWNPRVVPSERCLALRASSHFSTQNDVSRVWGAVPFQFLP